MLHVLSCSSVKLFTYARLCETLHCHCISVSSMFGMLKKDTLIFWDPSVFFDSYLPTKCDYWQWIYHFSVDNFLQLLKGPKREGVVWARNVEYQNKTSTRQGRRSLWDREDMSPQGGTSMVMSPPRNILKVMSFRLGLFYPVTARTVVVVF